MEPSLTRSPEKAMSLKETLAAMRAASRARIPPETQAVMRRAVDDVRASGILERVVKTGQRAPDFTLPNTEGGETSLATLLGKGHVVLSFFRGRW
jgi:hypothetical protein